MRRIHRLLLHVRQLEYSSLLVREPVGPDHEVIDAVLVHPAMRSSLVN